MPILKISMTYESKIYLNTLKLSKIAWSHPPKMALRVRIEAQFMVPMTETTVFSKSNHIGKRQKKKRENRQTWDAIAWLTSSYNFCLSFNHLAASLAWSSRKCQQLLEVTPQVVWFFNGTIITLVRSFTELFMISSI